MRTALSLALPLAAALVLVACEDGTGDGRREYTPGFECFYEFVDVTANEAEERPDFPSGLFPAEWRELGSGLSIKLVDPEDESRDLTLTVPQCFKDEALAEIEDREQQDAEQEAAGTPFPDRTYR